MKNRNKKYLIGVFGILFVLQALAASDTSEFNLYKPESVLNGNPHAPILNSKDKKHFKTVLRDAAKEGPNFNGHYRIVTWGCGTNCIEWAIIDLENGNVSMNGSVGSCWPYNVKGQDNENIPDWLEFKISSSLIYSNKCNDETGELTFNLRDVLVWKKGKLKLIRQDKTKY